MEWVYLSLAVICKSCRDICEWNWAESVFYPNPYFMHNWERLYWRTEGGLERKKWLGLIPIPALFFDGWHGFEWLQWLCIALALYTADGLHLIDIVRIGVLVLVIHTITYKFLLRRSFWQ